MDLYEAKEALPAILALVKGLPIPTSFGGEFGEDRRPLVVEKVVLDPRQARELGRRRAPAADWICALRVEAFRPDGQDVQFEIGLVIPISKVITVLVEEAG